jgi:gliding motility-associated-like protein
MISGLTANAPYQVSYTDDGVPVGPIGFTANGSGQITITGLNAGLYSNIVLDDGSTVTDLNTGVILSNPIYIPTFPSVPPFCAGTTAPVLPTTSNNGLTGTWTPAVVDNQNSGTYTFTPTGGQCGVNTSILITVNPRITPTFTFGTSLVICGSGSVPTLATTSTNSITGTWNPSVVDNQHSGTYTFTPNAGQCANGTTFTVTVNPNITPTFSFGTSSTICAGGTVPTLPATSGNGITGTWSPSTVDNQNTGTYTFTPNAGQCATTTTFTQTVNPNVTPVFSFATTLSICAGSAAPVLPGTSSNGITGTWNPATASNQNSGSYTFTPTAGQCAVPFTVNITVMPKPTPSFPFGSSLSICAGGVVPVLPTTSTDGFAGTWNPSVVDNQNSGTYTFIPSVGQCANNATFTVRVNPILTPAFSFGTSATICAGATVPVLPATSTNSVTGTWSPAVVDNQNSGTYTFTPIAGQCATTTTFSVTINPVLTPVFSFGPSLTICAGGTVPVLPTTSDNGITGTWNPAVVNNQAGGTYTFTSSTPCVVPYVYTVTVNPIVTPTFSFGTFQSVCIGSVAPILPTSSIEGVAGTWSPSVVDNQNTGTYTFTPAAGQCANTTTLNYEVNPVPSVTVRADTTVYDGAIIPSFSFTTTNGGLVQWTNSNAAIGLAASGNGNVPSFTAVNMTNDPVKGMITATPYVNGCLGSAQTYMVNVLPLNKDVFVPNVFSPNGDGKNDILYAYGNYIDKIEMRIFNQWGQEMAVITTKSQGWDGRFKGTPQPVGVYVYVLKAVLSNGNTVNKKGSITLVR